MYFSSSVYLNQFRMMFIFIFSSPLPSSPLLSPLFNFLCSPPHFVTSFLSHHLHSILFYSILFWTILFYSILLYSTLFYSILFYSILFYSILVYSILFWSILFYFGLFHSILFYFGLFHSILFYSTAAFNAFLLFI